MGLPFWKQVRRRRASVAANVRVPINSDADIVSARQQGRSLARELGFSLVDQTVIATAISELARNIVEYAKRGEIEIGEIGDGRRRGMMVVARDSGPGMADVSVAMQDGYSTSNSLGLGLPGTRRMMDDFDIVSQVGKGTTITVKKWAPGDV
ncbi:MAG: anti-sigma regulatory factor [Chloroflexi bacterium]|nr:anti-sigma regulatory factor [Chloroflexota bacterium]